MKKKADLPVRLGGDLRSSQVANQLVQEMRSGCYAEATQLPAEVELAVQLDVSRTVVRDAFSELERAGYIERVRGIGTVINRDVVNLDNRMDRKLEFYKMIRSAGKQPYSDHLYITKEEATPELAASLGMDPNEGPCMVLYVCKRVLADSQPVLYSTDILPLSLFNGMRLENIDFSRPIFEIVQECGVLVTSTVAHLSAVQGEPMVRRQLGLTPEQALLQLDETCYDRLCKPVLRCRTCYTNFFDFSIVRKLL